MPPATSPDHRPLRVAYVISSRGVGGAEKLVTALLQDGRSRGFDQLVLNPFSENNSAEALRSEWICADFEAFPCSNLFEVLKLRAWLIRRLRAFSPDIIHVALFHAAVIMRTVPRDTEKRVLTHVYGEGLAKLSWPKLRFALDRWASRGFDHISAISEAVRTFLKSHDGYPASRIGKIVLGWEGSPLPKRPDPDRPPTIICVAVLRKEKGHDALLTAFKQVSAELRNARLVLIGDGPWRQNLERQIDALGLSDRVEMRGRVPEVWPHLAEADLFVLASPMEALGIAVMEAMAAGLPAIVSNVGGLPEFVEEGVTGELFEPGDARELAGKIIEQLRDANRMARMSEAALAAAPALHIKTSVVNYIRLYQGLLEDRVISPSCGASELR